MTWIRTQRIMLAIAASLLLGGTVAVGDTTADEAVAAGDAAAQQAALAKQSQNPVANLISIPFEFWHHEGQNGDGFGALVKPVIPTPVGSLNLINRFILPYASISGVMLPPDGAAANTAVDENGLLDLTYQGFLSPAEPGAVIWGAGWALQIPTASNDVLGTERWSLGPSGLVLSMPLNWVLGPMPE